MKDFLFRHRFFAYGILASQLYQWAYVGLLGFSDSWIAFFAVIVPLIHLTVFLDSKYVENNHVKDEDIK